MHTRPLQHVPMIVLCALLGLGAASGSADVVFEVDLERSELRVVASGVRGPSFRVATGSPQHPTPIGDFKVARWIGNPTYTPGPEARRRGALPMGASEEGPLGFAKMPFFKAFQVHGGASRYAIGIPSTLGCVQLTNDAMRELSHWLADSGILDQGTVSAQGERIHAFVRPAVIRIR